MGMELSIIIPAYNEAERITNTINSIYSEFKNDIEVIVVSNGSVDGTCKIVRPLSKKFKNLKYLEYKKRVGKGKAITKGLEIAKGNKMGFLDADDAFDIKGINYLISLLDEGYDCAIASKWKGQSFNEVPETFFRKILSRIWNLLVRIIIGLNYYDTQGGAKFLTKKAYQKINNDFICSGFEFDVELLLKLKKSNCKVKEVFIDNKCTKESKFKYKYMLPMLYNLFRIYWNYIIIK